MERGERRTFVPHTNAATMGVKTPVWFQSTKICASGSLVEYFPLIDINIKLRFL